MQTVEKCLLRPAVAFLHNSTVLKNNSIVRRDDDLGRIVIPKEIRRTLRIREGDPLYTSLTSFDLFLHGILAFTHRIPGE